MRKRTAGLALAVALVLAGLLLPGGTAQAETFKLRLKESLCGQDDAFCKNLETSSKGHFGDSLVFSLPLVRQSNKERIGRDEGECITLHADAERYYCTFVAHLPKGDISVQGALKLNSGQVSVLPITGGTESYLGASGYWQQNGRNVVLHIVTP